MSRKSREFFLVSARLLPRFLPVA